MKKQAPRPAARIECYGCDAPVAREGDVCRLCQPEFGRSHIPPHARSQILR